jgi:3'-phosphoadenosine 5'-phosphosulfate sulfotransferase (PAPS reductase)/FAD synthetase
MITTEHKLAAMNELLSWRAASPREALTMSNVWRENPPPRPRALPVAREPEHVPDLRGYSTVIVTFSGGKDSLASLIRTVELGREQGRDLIAERAIELWHHDVDSPEEGIFMDWPITHDYVRKVGEALGIPVYFSWRVGGFMRELMKQDARSAPVRWQEPGGKIGQSGGIKGKIATRRKFPQVTANLRERWCSGALKIDVSAAAIRGQRRFKGRRTLVTSGERAQESAGRARYKQFEPDRAASQGRHVDRWRPVHQWSVEKVWEAVRRWGVVAHPAYRAGFGRASCAFCIFGSPDQWATVKELMPTGFERIAELERTFGLTIQRKEAVGPRAARGHAYEALGVDVEEGRRLAVQPIHDAPVLVPPDQWVLPLGAFAESAGPT